MRQLHVSVAGLMAATGVAGVGIAALARPSQLWASVVYSATAALLLVAVILAASREGGRRPFWLGFAVFGWGHQILAFWPGPNASPAPRLLTTFVLDLIHFLVSGSGGDVPAYLRSMSAPVLTEEVFYQVGLSLMGLCVASLGGVFAARMFARDEVGAS